MAKADALDLLGETRQALQLVERYILLIQMCGTNPPAWKSPLGNQPSWYIKSSSTPIQLLGRLSMRSQSPSLLVEQFGPLQGMRVLSTGTIVAEPVAAGMAAEMGAEVIHIERPGEGEDWREAEFPISGPNGEQIASSWIQDRRNTYYTTLDFSTPEGQEIFLKLIQRTDIWMESSKASSAM